MAATVGELLQQHGESLKAIYWTVGPYDIVAIAEAADMETATTALLQVRSLGNVRTTTLQAFDRDQFSAIIDRTG